jgi:PAS domain S-box-containing protein
MKEIVATPMETETLSPSHRMPARPEDWLLGGGEMGRFVRAMDWSKTELGPIDSWPQSLRTTVSLCLASNFPISLVWGPGHVQLYNDGYWPICGAKHPQAMGANFTQCWASAWPVIGEVFERACAGEASYLENQRMFLDRNGYLEETFFTFSFSPIRDESGGVGGLFHPVTETTNRMLSERRTQTLRELVARAGEAQTCLDACRLAVEALAAASLDLPFVLLYVFDRDDRMVRLVACAGLDPATPASPLFVDLSLPVPIVWPFAELLRSRRTELVRGIDKELSSTPCGPYPEPPKFAQLLPICLPGRDQPFGVLIAGVSARLPLDDGYGAFYELLGSAVTTAVTNARAHEDAQKRAEALAEIDREKTAFFANVSHEFRTPLTLMLGPIEDELAENSNPLPAPRLERLATAHRNSLRLLKLVNTLLDFSRLESSRTQGSFEPIELAAFTAELASVFRAAIEKAGLTLSVDCPPLPELLYVDRDMWEKIVLNLISNALKHTFEGDIRVAVEWRADHAVLIVRDSGVGIPPADHPRVFERFHRVHGARSRTHEGSGIGLSLVAQLVALHGGAVQVESREGSGSKFEVKIPAGLAHLPPDRILGARTTTPSSPHAAEYVQEALQWAAADSVPPPPLPEDPGSVQGAQDARRPCIVLADDNTDMRDYVRRLLSSRYDVIAVRDGMAALTAALERGPDLILSDIMMPGLDGLQLIAKLRADPRTQCIPVILLSARAGEEATVSGIEAGADDYLTKPFSARTLLARVQTLIELSRARRTAADAAKLQANEATAQAIRLGEAKLRRVIDTAIVGVIVATLDGAVLQANDAYLRILGYDREDLLAGRVFRSAISPPEWATPDDEAVEELRSTGALQLREREYLRKDGRRVPVLIGGVVLDDEYVGYVVDLSELSCTRSAPQESQRALRRSEEQLR